MKKLPLCVLALVLVVALYLAGCASSPGGGSRIIPHPYTGDRTKTTLENGGFEQWLQGWYILSGEAFTPAVIADSGQTFWGERDFMAVGERFLNGYENPEKATGVLASAMFTLAGDGYISFLMGGSRTNRCFISIHTEDGREIARHTNVRNFRDPEMSLNMNRVYMHLPNFIGQVLYIQLNDNDNRDGDFAAMTADDFIVSMTEADVKAMMVSTYNKIMALEDIAINRYIKHFYRTKRYPFPLEEVLASFSVQ